MLDLLCALLTAYFLVLVARIIFSWIPVSEGSVMGALRNVSFTLTEPVLGPLRRLIPPVGAGGMALDLSPIIVFIALNLLMSTINCGLL